MQSTAIGPLQALGLTRSEALAYLSLLADEGPAGLTGYEVSARSGVPRSAVYTVLSRLEALGACFRSGEGPTRYVATDPTGFLRHLRADTEARLAEAAEQLARIPKRRRPEPVWVFGGYDEVLQEAARLLAAATQKVLISAWVRELDALATALSACAARPGLHRVLHSPDLGDGGVQGFSAWTDAAAVDPEKAGWSHKLIVVVDGAEALIGGAEPTADNDSVRTRNRSLVDLATNHVILDITRIAAASGRSCGDAVAPFMRPHLAVQAAGPGAPAR